MKIGIVFSSNAFMWIQIHLKLIVNALENQNVLTHLPGMVLMSGSSSCLAGDGFCCFWDNTTATLIKTICKLKFLNKNHTYCAILKCTEKEADGNHCCGSTGQYCMAVRKVEGD